MIQLYHYTERKIRGHIFVCFIALQMKVLLTQKLEEIGEDLTYSEVMRDVRKIRAVEVKIGDKKVITRTNLKGKADLAFRAIGGVIPPKIIGIERIE